MTRFSASLARWIDRQKGEAHSYACDYAAWWLEGGREPNADDYILEDDEPRIRFSRTHAQKIAAFIRVELPEPQPELTS